MTAVLDSSAVIALLRQEPGHQVVADHLSDAVISTVNWAEIVQKVLTRGWPMSAVRGLRSLGVHVLPFTAAEAERSAELWEVTRSAGLSLGDRACLAVTVGIPDGTAVTADRAWADLDVGVPVQLIR